MYDNPQGVLRSSTEFLTVIISSREFLRVMIILKGPRKKTIALFSNHNLKKIGLH